MINLWNRSKPFALALACCALTVQCSGGDAQEIPNQAESLSAPGAVEPTEPGAETVSPSTAQRAPVEPEVSPVPDAALPPGGISLIDEGPTTRDLGEVREGGSVETVFELVSDGEGPLVISSVTATCGCTVPGIELLGRRGEPVPYELNSPIPVGRRLRLLTKVFTQGKAGSFSASIMLKTNDPVGLFSVRVEVEVEPVLECIPDRKISVGQMGPQDYEVRAVRVRAFRGERFLLRTDLVPSGIQIDLSPVEPDADGRASEWEVALGIGPGLPPGDANLSIQLMSDLRVEEPRKPSPDGSPQYHPVTLVVHKLGLIYAQPAFLSFGSIEPGGSAQRTIKIQSRDGSKFPPAEDMTVEIMRTDNRPFDFADYVTTSLQSVDDGEAVELRMKLDCPPLEEDRSFLSIVKVRVGHPEQDVLSFNFTVTFEAEEPAGAGN